MRLSAKEMKEIGDVLQSLNRPANEFETELTVADIRRIFQMEYDAAYRLVVETLEPMGAAKKIRKKYYISPWGVRRLIGQTGRCPSCGRQWTMEKDVEYLMEKGMQPDPVVYKEALKDPDLARFYPELPPPPKVDVIKDGPWSKRKQREYLQELRKLTRNPSTVEAHMEPLPRSGGLSKEESVSPPPVNPDPFKK